MSSRLELAPEDVAGGPLILLSADTLVDIYANNFFPEMQTDWRTHPDHIGHKYTLGCFRCHDDMHESPEGKTISADCNTCHTLLAIEEENPEILKTLQGEKM